MLMWPLVKMSFTPPLDCYNVMQMLHCTNFLKKSCGLLQHTEFILLLCFPSSVLFGVPPCAFFSRHLSPFCIIQYFQSLLKLLYHSPLCPKCFSPFFVLHQFSLLLSCSLWARLFRPSLATKMRKRGRRRKVALTHPPFLHLIKMAFRANRSYQSNCGAALPCSCLFVYPYSERWC